MPLTYSALTGPSRIMLPIYTVVFPVMGLSYLLSPSDRLRATPSLRFADGFLGVPLHGWAVMFLACGLLMLLAWPSRSRTLFRFALLYAAICLTIWTIVAFVAAFRGETSFSA